MKGRIRCKAGGGGTGRHVAGFAGGGGGAETGSGGGGGRNRIGGGGQKQDRGGGMKEGCAGAGHLRLARYSSYTPQRLPQAAKSNERVLSVR